MSPLTQTLRRLRVTAHLMPSGWVFELAALLAAVCWIAELVKPS